MGETPLEAELIDSVAARREISELNLALTSTVVVIIAFVVMALIWGSGAFDGRGEGFDASRWWDVPLEQRHLLDLNMTGWRSQLPEDGPFGVLPMSDHFIEVDLPLEEQDAGYPEAALMHVALWLPDVPEGTLVPVIATIHPYYDFGGEGIAGDDSTPNTIPDRGVGQWVLEEFVPYGYALAQVSTFGSGQSTHCQDVKGRGEQIGIDAAVTWLGEQEWSNGNVGIMGKSYAGTTAWEGAQFGNPHLKTIVPISGSIGVQQMFYRNGSAESRSMVYDLLYQGATADLTTDDMRICSDDIIGPASPITTWAGAEVGGDRWSDYWEERFHLPDVLANYEGSVYLVWGMQDWNVDVYHAFPTYQLLREKGLTVRAIMGQWGHNYPDQPSTHSELESGYGKEAYPEVSRMDWAIELYNWFNYYLKDIGEEPESLVQMQRNDGRWHIEETWPPADVEWKSLNIGGWDGGFIGTVSATQSMTITSPPLGEELHISGMPTLHFNVRTNLCNGGQMFVTMKEGTSGLRLGHATMDVRYRDGGYEAQAAVPLNDYRMLMEFNPMDVIIPAGSTIQLVLTENGEDYLPSSCAAVGLVIVGGKENLGLPVIVRADDDPRWFDVPAWWEQVEE